MNLIHRDQQLTVLDEMFTDCCHGRAKVTLINGAVATGKTALLRAFVKNTLTAVTLFTEATASRAEQTLPLGVLDQLLRNAELPTGFADRAALVLDDGILAAFRHGPGLTPDSCLAPILTGAWIDSLRSLLHDLAKERPIIIAIDNAHYADQHSLLCLSHVIRRLTSARILLILVGGTSLREQYALLDAEFLSYPDFRDIRLELLPESGVADLIAERLGRQTAELLAPAFYQASSGNPLLVNALIADHLASPRNPPTAFVTGDMFEAAVTNCLYRCDPVTSEVARALAVVGEAFPATLLDELLELRATSSGAALDALSAMGLVESGRFRHEAARTAVLKSLSPTARAVLHRRAAGVLSEHGAAPTDIAPHLVAADWVEPAWMIRVLQEAAAQALSNQDVDAAIRYLRLAHKSCTGKRVQAAVTSALEAAEWQVVPSVSVRHLPELCKAARAGYLTGRQATQLIMHLIWYGWADEAHEILDFLAREDPPCTSSETGLPLEQDRLSSLLSSFYPDSLDIAAPDPGPGRMDDPWDRENPAPGPSGGGQLAATLSSLAEQAMPGDDQIPPGSLINNSYLTRQAITIMSLIAVDRSAEAAAYCKRLLAEFTGTRVLTWLAIFSALYSTVNLRLGNPAAAKKHASTALSLISPQGWGVAIGIPLGSILLAATTAGEYVDAAAYLNTPVPEAMFTTPFALPYLHARGTYHVAVSNFHAALSDFQACGQLMSRWRLDKPSLIPWRSGAAEACLGLGRQQQASELVHQQLARVGADQHRTRGISLRVSAAASDLACRPVVLGQAIVLLSKCGDRVELARALADLSQAHDKLGEGRQARLMARRARHLANQCGLVLHWPMSPERDEPAPECPPSQSPGPPLAELSDAESRVATLAAHGYTNRDIADHLCITVSTVEQHLTRVYRKLNVNRRTDLPVSLGVPMAAKRNTKGR